MPALIVTGVAGVIAWFMGYNLASLTLYALVGGLASFLSWVIGIVSTVLTYILFQILPYNDFINEEVVKMGWVTVRDLCNMFFILILLVIAFATILRVESYSWKKNLPKLLIMAVLINFSKTICGLVINFSQVIMLTFVNAFASAGSYSLYTIFGLQNLFTIKTAGKSLSTTSNIDTNSGFAVAGSLVLGLLLMIVATIVILIYTIILIYRIIMLWILIILSPLAFLAMAIPAGAKYASQWMGEFTKYLIIGPVMAFFLWLALSMATTTTMPINYQYSASKDGAVNIPTAPSGTGSTASEPANMKQFLVTTIFLIASLMMAQQMGGAAGGMAGGALNKMKSAGLGLAKGAGKAAAYVPAQYVKKAGYGLGDMALGQLKKVPIIGNLAMEGQGRLRMHRDFAEEKDTKYMQYMEEQDLDRVIARQRSTGIISTLGKGMESKRQMFKRALTEKMKRGDEWGQSKNEKMDNKTRAMIELAQLARHSVTSSGEDAFRDADLGKLWHEFRNRNAGMIDDSEMRAYYKGGQGQTNYVDKNGQAHTRNWNYAKGLAGGDNSEYWRGPDPVTGEPRSPDSMAAYTAIRMRMNEVHNLHHENFIPRQDATGDHYDILDAVYDEGNGSMKTLAQIRDRGTRQQKVWMKKWMGHRLTTEQAGGTPSTYFKDIWNDYQAANPGATQDQCLNEMMGNGGLQVGKDRDRIGASRAIMGQTSSAEVASGITGLGRVNRGVMAASFGELGLENSAAKYFAGADKAKIASRISGALQENGMAEAAAKAVGDQINKASYLILHNKDAGVSPSETRTAHTHELMHARLGANFSQDELKGVWNSMDGGSRDNIKKQVSAKWGSNMSEDAIMNEYFAEGLTAKTRWGKGAAVSLNQTAESGLDGLLKAKGSNISAFTSNVMANRPSSDNVRQAMAGSVDSSLKDTLDELIGTLRDVGNGFSSIENFSSNLNNLQRTMERNRTGLENSVKSYKSVTDKLNNLSSKIS